jgi:hypothetical protein
MSSKSMRTERARADRSWDATARSDLDAEKREALVDARDLRQLRHRPADHRRDRCRTCRLRPSPMEDRNRDLQRSQGQRTQPRAQFRPRKADPRQRPRHPQPAGLRPTYRLPTVRSRLAHRPCRPWQHDTDSSNTSVPSPPTSSSTIGPTFSNPLPIPRPARLDGANLKLPTPLSTPPRSRSKIKPI